MTYLKRLISKKVVFALSKLWNNGWVEKWNIGFKSG